VTVSAAEFWDDEAPTFDEQSDHGLTDPAVRGAWAGLLLPLMPSPTARVADLGCGTGSLGLLLAEAGHRVSGLDISPAMVNRAREKLAASGYDVDIILGDAARPPWPRSSFDVVLTRHVLWAMTDPDSAVMRWVDLLAPEGILLLVEGRWWTGSGMGASDVAEIVLRYRSEAEVVVLDDPALWGGPTTDERFIVVSRH
jgi:SAM-dependent methyltransferase